MGKSYKHEIGDWVDFKTYLKVTSCDGKRQAHKIELVRSKIGQICGAIVRHLGDIKSDEEDYHNFNSFLIIRKAVVLYQVRDGMLNVPYEVREEDIRKIDALDLHSAGIKKLPWKKVQLTEWARKALSQQAKSQQRDAKGRFIRYHLKVVNQ